MVMYALVILNLPSLVHFNFSFSFNYFVVSLVCPHALLCPLSLSCVPILHVLVNHQPPLISFLTAYDAVTSSNNYEPTAFAQDSGSLRNFQVILPHFA